MIRDYIGTYDPAIHAWRKRNEAERFALYLAGELMINPKGVTVDKDGKTYRVYVPLLSLYWEPETTVPSDWHHALSEIKMGMSTWAR